MNGNGGKLVLTPSHPWRLCKTPSFFYGKYFKVSHTVTDHRKLRSLQTHQCFVTTNHLSPYHSHHTLETTEYFRMNWFYTSDNNSFACHQNLPLYLRQSFKMKIQHLKECFTTMVWTLPPPPPKKNNHPTNWLFVCWLLLYSTILRSWADSPRLHVVLHEWSYLQRVFEYPPVVYLQHWHGYLHIHLPTIQILVLPHSSHPASVVYRLLS